MRKTTFITAMLVLALANLSNGQESLARVLRTSNTRNSTISTIVPKQAITQNADGTTKRTTYHYDESELYLSEEIVETNNDNGWVNEARIIYEYDFSGFVYEKIAQLWNGIGWEGVMVASYEYDGDELSEIIYQVSIEGSWVNSMKEVYNYNYDDNTSTITMWDWSGTTWTTSELYTYTYSDLSTELLIQYMQGGAWQNSKLQVQTFDFDGNVINILNQKWQNSTWVNEELVTYNYTNGVYTEQLVQRWQNEWIDSFRFNFQYDALGNATQGECLKKEGGSWVLADGEICMAYSVEEERATKSFDASTVEMTYDDLTYLDENKAVVFTVFPQPAENIINVHTERFLKAEICSMTGQKLMECRQNKMDVGHLGSGIYLLKVFDKEGNNTTQQIVVK